MRRLALFALGLATAAAAAAADSAGEDRRVREIASRYASCIIASSPGRARQYLMERGQAPIDGGCLVSATRGVGGAMRFPAERYRYALAGALLTRDYPAGIPAEVGNAPALSHEAPAPLDEARLPRNAKRAEAARAACGRRRAVWIMDQLGDCTARSNPAAAYALARSEVGSPAERAAFDALKLAIGGCLNREGTVRFAPGTLRGAIELNLYRLAYSLKKPDHA